jgi:hypothetical protein
MRHFFQETDSQIVYPVPLKQYYITNQLSNETVGRCFRPSIVESNQLRRAWESIYSFANQELAEQASRLLTVIQEVLDTLRFMVDLSCIPTLHPFSSEDGSVLFEWIFSDYRIGFSIEPNQEESSWYLITKKNLGEISASGYISGVDVRVLVLWLLNFIISNENDFSG